MQSAIKDGYESDSTLVFKRRAENHTARSTTPSESKTLYSQIQKGGEIPTSGLRMSLPERPRGKVCMYFPTTNSFYSISLELINEEW